MADLGVHTADLAVHAPDLGVHARPIWLFTTDRNPHWVGERLLRVLKGAFMAAEGALVVVGRREDVGHGATGAGDARHGARGAAGDWKSAGGTWSLRPFPPVYLANAVASYRYVDCFLLPI
jgi:hypothetical protein